MFLHLSPLTIQQFFSLLKKGNGSVRVRGLWKFDKSLISDSDYTETMKKNTFVKLYGY